jgi:hypothetical protein
VFPLKMSTPMEVATAGLREARESLSRAECILEKYVSGTLRLPAGVTPQDLKNELNCCRAVLQGAEKTLVALAAQNTQLSPQSSITPISCKSQSIDGRCSTGRHTDRNKGIQNLFKKMLVKRDTCCIATETTEGSVAAHIVPLNKSELIARDMLFSPRNGVLLHKVLKDDYDRHQWIFDEDGNVTVLYSNWVHKNTIRRVKVSKDPETGPSKELIELHNKMAWEEKQHHCPHCWKYVGAINVENHTARSCEMTDNIGDEDVEALEDSDA